MGHRFMIATAALLFSGCVSNADKNQDGTVDELEFCETEYQLYCDYDLSCSDHANAQERYDQCLEMTNADGTCEYFSARCNFSEQNARDCITTRSAEVTTCEPQTDQACIDVWQDCDFSHD